MILIEENLKSRDEVLNKVAQIVHQEGFVTDTEGFKFCILKREDEAPTSIGFDVAIPHCRSSHVIKPFIFFTRLQNKIVWDKRNDEEVELIFTLGVPEKDGNKLHLKFLSAISKKLMHEDFRHKLKTINNQEEIYQLLEEINEKIGEV